MHSPLLQPWAAVLDLFSGGGFYVILIFGCGLLLWTLIIDRYVYFLRRFPKEVEATVAVWNAREDKVSWCARQIRAAMISRLNVSMSSTLPVLAVLVPMAPLLGLIGTVSGMLEVFDSMAIRGSADAKTMASGVSHAMICTMTGLAVSITGLYPAHYFKTRVRRETELLADHLGF